MMTIELFEEKYKNKGGIDMLRIMTEDKLLPLKVIAGHYGVSNERVRQWTKELFGKKYDPREARRERRIDLMISHMYAYGEISLKKTFKHDNKKYINEAIKRVKGIKLQ